MSESVYRPLVLVLLLALGGVGAANVMTAREQLAESQRIATEAAAAQRSAREELPRWEYRTVSVHADINNSRQGPEAAAFGSVTPQNEPLDVLGAEGWELVTSYLEMETAWTNFGSSRYVTGIQPNVRPQRVVLIFRRPLRAPAAPAAATPRPAVRT